MSLQKDWNDVYLFAIHSTISVQQDRLQHIWLGMNDHISLYLIPRLQGKKCIPDLCWACMLHPNITCAFTPTASNDHRSV